MAERTVITVAGLQAFALARASGIKLTVATFAVGSGGPIPPAAADPSITALVTQKYTAAINSVRQVSEDTIELIAMVPNNQPAAGVSWNLNEAAFFLDSGAMLCYGSFEVVVKDGDDQTEFMIRTQLRIAGAAQASATFVEIGNAWTCNFRGETLLTNSALTQFGYNGIELGGIGVSVTEGRIMSGWNTWGSGSTAAELVVSSESAGLGLVTANEHLPVYMMQDLPRYLVGRLKGKTVTFRVRAKSAGTTPLLRLAVIYDRDTVDEDIQTSDEPLTATFGEVSLSDTVPDDITNISVGLAPLQTDKTTVDWAIMNVEDEQTMFAPQPDQQSSHSECIHPSMPVAEVKRIFGAIAAGVETGKYMRVRMLPGIYNWDEAMNYDSVWLEADGYVRIQLSITGTYLRVAGLSNLDVEGLTDLSSGLPDYLVQVTEGMEGLVRITTRNVQGLAIADDVYCEDVEITGEGADVDYGFYMNTAGKIATFRSLKVAWGLSVPNTALGTYANAGKLVVGRVDSQRIQIGNIGTAEFSAEDVVARTQSETTSYPSFWHYSTGKINIGHLHLANGQLGLIRVGQGTGGRIGLLTWDTAAIDVINANAFISCDGYNIVAKGTLGASQSLFTGSFYCSYIRGDILLTGANAVIIDISGPVQMFDIDLDITANGIYTGIVGIFVGSSVWTCKWNIKNYSGNIITTGLSIGGFNVYCSQVIIEGNFTNLIDAVGTGLTGLHHCHVFLETAHSTSGSVVAGTKNVISNAHIASGATPATWVCTGSYNKLMGVGRWTLVGVGNNQDDCIQLP